MPLKSIKPALHKAVLASHKDQVNCPPTKLESYEWVCIIILGSIRSAGNDWMPRASLTALEWEQHWEEVCSYRWCKTYGNRRQKGERVKQFCCLLKLLQAPSKCGENSHLPPTSALIHLCSCEIVFWMCKVTLICQKSLRRTICS